MTCVLTSTQQALHDRAIEVGKRYRRSEIEAIEVLQEIDRTRLYKRLDCSSLFLYAVKFMGLDESIAYPMITVARRAREIPQLQRSLKENKLSVVKANRIVGTLTAENATRLVGFAETNSTAEINREVARQRKFQGLPVKLRTLKVSDETLVKVKRGSALMKSGTDLDAAINIAFEEYLERHDPVRKAKRALDRRNLGRTMANRETSKNTIERPASHENGGKVDVTAENPIQGASTPSTANFCLYRNLQRKPLTAEEKHQVFARDGGQCTHRHPDGSRCENEKFLHIHHIKPVSQGGTNDPENLTTLCFFHHDLAHQLTLPIEGQVTWLRDLRLHYGPT